MLVLYNANIITMDPSTPNVSAIALDRGRILAAGSDQEIISNYLKVENPHGSDEGMMDLQGRVVIPGLTDAHIHLENFALSLQKIDCETHSRAECIQRVADQVRVKPVGSWILGHGWNQNNWTEGFGSRTDLDAVAPLNPVYLTAKSLHAAWANSTALQIAKLDRNTPDPPGGRLGRDDQGELTGILFESAMELVSSVIPTPDENDLVKVIDNAQPVLWRMGLTGVHDFDRRRCFSALQILGKAGKLKLRVLKSLPLEDLDHAIAIGLRSGFGNDMLRVGGIKAFSDGALGPQTAAMFQPYNGSNNNRGMLFLDSEELYEYGQKAIQNGFSMAVHAIGDRANHEVLDAFLQLRELEGNLDFGGDVQKAIRSGFRHRIEHVQVIHPDDANRLAKLGVVASMQPIHATSDMFMADRYWGERAALSYAWRTQLQNGAVLAFGSDAPVESPNPFWGIFAAITRRRKNDSTRVSGWYPEQKLDVMEALRAYTTGPAYTASMEDRIGKISPGYWADLAVLSENPFTCSPEELYEIESTATMVAGEWVYSKLF